jgi:Holliday junction DNA helicase RuvA
MINKIEFKLGRKQEMLAYIKGTLEMKMTEYVVLDVGGLGYKVYMSDVGIEKLGNIGETVKVHTHYKVREDDISIYGFNTLEELKMFELLLSVSGVGAKTALTMLAVCSPSEFALAVISEDIKALTGIPGIGPKSAKRIILELKDKLKTQKQIEDINSKINESTNENNKLQKIIEDNEKVEEATAALQVLGYNKKEIEKVFSKVETKEVTTEELIKNALILLGK